MAKQSAKEIIEFLREKFVGRKFGAKELKEAYQEPNLNVSYFMSILVNQGAVVQIKRGLWSLPERSSSESKTLYVSRAERGILDAILKMELKSENGFSRFGINKLIEILNEEESALLPDLLPKLKNVGILSCAGTGTQGKILEIKDELFLKYVTDPDSIKEISLTDLEIDQKIKRFLSEADRKQNKSLEISERMEIAQKNLAETLNQIKALETNKDLLEKEIKELKQDLDKLKDANDEVEKQFVELIANMNPERRREIFKKILVK